MKNLTWRRKRRFVRPESLLLIHRLSGRSEPFRFAGVPVILRLPDVAPGGKAGYGRHELDLRQLLVFTGGRVEELLRVLDHPSHGLDRTEVRSQLHKLNYRVDVELVKSVKQSVRFDVQYDSDMMFLFIYFFSF